MFPYQPGGIWKELAYGGMFTAQVYRPDSGADLYRRSLYTFWKRTVPPPSLGAFDAPDREKCIARRARTNTPLQALVLMNDPTYVEASRALAQKTILEGGRSPVERIRYAYLRALAREPSAEETRLLSELSRVERGKFRKTPSGPRGFWQSAIRLATNGSRPTSWLHGPPSPAASSISTKPSARSSGAMDPHLEYELAATRRQFFGRSATGIGAAALASLLQRDGYAAPAAPHAETGGAETGGLAGLPHFAPRAKRVVFLFQSGAPSQIDLFDYKPQLRKFHKQELPDSIRRGQRITGMTRDRTAFRSPLRSSSSSGTAGAAPGSASCSRTLPRSSTTSP